MRKEKSFRCRLLAAGISCALVFTMIPSSVQYAFAENSDENTGVSAYASGEMSDVEVKSDNDYGVTHFDRKITAYTTGGVNLRKGPATSYDKVGYLSGGTEIQIQGFKSNKGYVWYEIEYEGDIVYVSYLYVDLADPDYEGRTAEAKQSVSVYGTDSSYQAAVIFTIPAGKRFEITGRMITDNGYLYMIDYNGKTGVVKPSGIDFNPIIRTVEFKESIYASSSGSVNLRTGPTTDASVGVNVPKGTEFRVTARVERNTSTWYRLTYNNRTLYASGLYVDIYDTVYSPSKKGGALGTVKVYSEPSDDSEVLKTLSDGTLVEMNGTVKTSGKTYVEVEVSGVTGYADQKLIDNNPVLSRFTYSSSVKGKTTGAMNLRAGTTTSYKILAKVSKGTELEVLGKVNRSSGLWYKVRYNGKIMYGSSLYISIVNLQYGKVDRAYTTGTVNMRSAIGTNAKIITKLPETAILEVLTRYSTSTGYWYRVKYAGTTGYVSGAYMKIGKVGIDVSKYNTKIDWKEVKESGIDFVFIRAGYTGWGNGLMVSDPYFEQHIEGAIDAGLEIGVYYFTQAITTSEAKEEVDYVNKLIAPYREHVTLPLVIDTEPSGSGQGRADFLSKTQRTKVVKAFCERAEYRGYEAMIYMSKSWAINNVDMSQLDQFAVWIAQYNVCNTTPYDYRYWQYTSDGSVPGITGRVDMNIMM